MVKIHNWSVEAEKVDTVCQTIFRLLSSSMGLLVAILKNK